MAKLTPRKRYVTKGDSLVIVWSLVDSEDQEIVTTGFTARLHVRDSAGMLLVDANTTNEKLVFVPTTNELTLRIEGSELSLPIGKYYYSLEITTNTGIVHTPEYGIIILGKDYTYD